MNHYRFLPRHSAVASFGCAESRNAFIAFAIGQWDATEVRQLSGGRPPALSGLQITVNSQLLSPRQRITGAPFALRAEAGRFTARAYGQVFWTGSVQ